MSDRTAIPPLTQELNAVQNQLTELQQRKPANPHVRAAHAFATNLLLNMYQTILNHQSGTQYRIDTREQNVDNDREAKFVRKTFDAGYAEAFCTRFVPLAAAALSVFLTCVTKDSASGQAISNVASIIQQIAEKTLGKEADRMMGNFRLQTGQTASGTLTQHAQTTEEQMRGALQKLSGMIDAYNRTFQDL